ncbi:MAG: OpgC domain-containing protein [Candidatus Hydrogenedentes bacterium]|nr:OpgC domain-containing protein [Candidatus Hydrogenedentota bacterium]
MGWQLLFFVGMVLGVKSTQTVGWVPKSNFLMMLAAALIVSAPLLRVTTFLDKRHFLGSTPHPLLSEIVFPYVEGKTNLSPLRLFHFFALIYLGAMLFPRNLSFWQSRWARPLMVIGQNSLEIFCFGVFLLYLVRSIVDWTAGGDILILTLNLLGFGAMYLAARALSWKNRQPWQAATEGPA